MSPTPAQEKKLAENTMNNLCLFVVVLASRFLVQAAIPSDTCDQNTWITDGEVFAIAPTQDKVYIGGRFAHVGPYTGCGVLVNSASGQAALPLPANNGIIRTACPDGNGGWFMGGDFNNVGGVTRNNVVHVLSNGSLDRTWNPNPDGSVYAIVLSGTKAYVGGSFSTIGGQKRHCIAALDVTTGNALAWNPNADSIVRTLAISGTIVYAGGSFYAIGGQTRSAIAAIDASTGNATAWNPNAGDVYCIVVNGTTVYAGGTFDIIGGQSRNNIAALDATTGKALDWNPNPDGGVWSMAVSGTTLYAGGGFQNIGGQNRNNIAALDATTGNATAWNPDAAAFQAICFVYSLAVSGTVVYAGGVFDTIGGQARRSFAALDAVTGNALPLNLRMFGWNHGSVLSIVPSGSTVSVGGDFYGINGLPRNNIAALDATTGSGLDWNPSADAPVQALVFGGTTVYAGGSFTKIGGQSNGCVAALDAVSGIAAPWNLKPRIAQDPHLPLSNPCVYSLALSGTTLYAGGHFDEFGGVSRNSAAINVTTGMIAPWSPNANNQVMTLATSGNVVYAGGFFSNIGGENRSEIAALDTGTGNALTWNPNANGSLSPYAFCRVSSLAVNGTTIYAGGYFSSIGGRSCNYLAALDAVTGIASSWNPGVFNASYSGTINTIASSGTTVYAGGYFDSIGGQSRTGVAALDATTGRALPWNPAISGIVNILAVSGSAIYLGGSWSGQGIAHPNFARFDIRNPGPVVSPIYFDPCRKNPGLHIDSYDHRSNAAFKFAYELTKARHVSLRVFTTNGRLQKDLVNRYQGPGIYAMCMQTGTLAPGSYVVSFKTGDFHQEKIFFVMK
jgi:hypothetical protein